MSQAAGTPVIAPASRSRLVATCWAADPATLADRVRVAADAFDALGPRGAAHLVEARLDLLARPPSSASLERIVRAAHSRLLATCRPGGTGSPRESARLRMLRRAVEMGARGCDVELGAKPPKLDAGHLLVVSHHAPEELTPEAAATLATRLGETALDAASAGAHVVAKLVAPAASAAGALRWADAAAATLPRAVDLAAIATGPGGAWMRQLASLHRLSQGRPLSVLAYVRAAEPLPGADLAQPLLADALGTWDIPGVSDATRVFAVVGWPLGRTWSPKLHDALFRRRHLDARLVALPLRDRADAGILDALRIEGVAATMPHKPLAAAMAELRSERVRRLGSANTLRRRGGAWEAEDFDGPAAAQALGRVMPLRDASIVIAGAGGAARAAALAMSEAGARVTILARRLDQAREAARIAGVAHAALDAGPVREADALVNASPAGSHGTEPLAIGDALPRKALLEMVTTPPTTPLLRAARDAGLACADGLTMLALQAAAQQRFWSEGRPDPPPREDGEAESILRDVAMLEERA